MSVTTAYTGTRIADMPDLGAVTDDSSFVAEHAGSGLMGALAVRDYIYAYASILITPQQFGATADGVHDDTAAFAQAIAQAAIKGGTVTVPMSPAAYKISGTLVVPSNVSIVGDAAKPQITTTAANFTLFSITGSDVTIANLEIQNSAKTGGGDISIDVAGGILQRIRISNILAWNSYGCIADTGSGTGIYISTWIDRVQARLLRGIGFMFQRSFAFLFVQDCVADFVNVVGANYAGFVLDNTALGGMSAVGGARFKNCDAEGTSTGTGANPQQTGFVFKNTTSLWLDSCDADTCDGYGWNFTSVVHIHMSMCTAGLCNNFGMIFSTCQFIEMVACRALGRVGAGAGAAANHGFCFSTGCSDVSLAACSAMNCTGSGFVVATGNTGPINISGGQSRANSAYGLFTAGTNAVLAAGMTTSANTSGNYNMAGTLHYMQASQLNSGSVVSVGPGPVSG